MMRSDKFRAKIVRTRQQQKQLLLAFPRVDGIADYNIDYVKVKGKKKEKKVTFIIVNNDNNNG